MEALPERYKKHKSHKALEPTKEQAANYIDTGTKDLTAETAAKRLEAEARKARLDAAIEAAGG